MGLELGIDIYTLLSTEEMTNRDLLYSTGNSTQYSAVAYMGKESKKNECIYTYIYIYIHICMYVCIYIYIYMAESLFCMPETNTIL